NDEIRGRTEDIAPGAIVVEIRGDDAEILGQCRVQGDRAAAAGLREELLRQRVEGLDRALHAGHLEMESRGGIKRYLGDDIGMHVGGGSVVVDRVVYFGVVGGRKG